MNDKKKTKKKTWSEKKKVFIANLTPHPLNKKLYGESTPLDDLALSASMRQLGQRSPIIVCGRGCASPEGTILGGERRWAQAAALGWAALDATVMHGLSPEEEEQNLISDNLAAYEHRKLTHRQRHDLEERLRALEGRKQGARTDLDPTKTGGSTDTIIASRINANPNEIRSRRKIFSSDVLVPELEQSLDDKTVPLTLAVTWVRDAEAVVHAGQAVSEAQDELRHMVETRRERARALGGPEKRGKRSKNVSPLTATDASDTSPATGQAHGKPRRVQPSSAEVMASLRKAKTATTHLLNLGVGVLLPVPPELSSMTPPTPADLAALSAYAAQLSEATPRFQRLCELLSGPAELFKHVADILQGDGVDE